MERRKAWHQLSAEITLEKEQKDAQDWMKRESRQKKEDLHETICHDIDTLKREMNVWDGPEDMLASLGRKLRTRGADGKAAETATAKRRKKEQWNNGYVFGAHLAVKAGYRVEGDDKVISPRPGHAPRAVAIITEPSYGESGMRCCLCC